MSASRFSFREFYLREQFFPGVVGIFINPFYFARKGLARHVSELAGHVAGKTLDVGCGNKPYAHLYHTEEYVGLEIDTPQNRADKKADFFMTASSFLLPVKRSIPWWQTRCSSTYSIRTSFWAKYFACSSPKG